ncbi:MULTISPECIES: ribosome maturation factor RimM [Terrabacteria group]|uniref:ribosome maturation factor RimM n=1 Tax=Bacillati TaxID=1783272 RepID=UPI0019395968|nr:MULTISPECIES: ribosome maturation factor RimM [Terrabacteria group]MBW9212067.1 ribosome maturation factor RimM [Trueperella sp. zg.1013]QRG87127.1 16S rRNA processing protein RimM [Bulleidia sp. zg-1006]
MKKIQVGYIQNTHGIKGELKIRPETDFPKVHFKKGKKLYLNGQKELEIASSRLQKELYLIQFVGYEDINLVQDWKGRNLFIDESNQVPLKKGEFYRSELVGLKAISEKGDIIGTITAIEETLGAQNNLRIKTNNKEVLYPFIPNFIDHVSLEEKKVYLNHWEQFQ